MSFTENDKNEWKKSWLHFEIFWWIYEFPPLAPRVSFFLWVSSSWTIFFFKFFYGKDKVFNFHSFCFKRESFFFLHPINMVKRASKKESEKNWGTISKETEKKMKNQHRKDHEMEIIFPCIHFLPIASSSPSGYQEKNVWVWERRRK